MAGSKGVLHEDLSRKDAAIGPSDRKFGFQVGGILLLLSVLLLGAFRWKHGGWTNPEGAGPRGWWLAIPGVLLVGAAATAPGVLRPLNRAWMGLALVLSWVLTPVVMFVLYCLVMVPFGVGARLMGKDLLRLRMDRGGSGSYWIRRDPPGPSPESMKNQF
ncbi:MAG: hypothetical protein U0574_11495 [Phycisphaerales bacterium]